MFARRTGMINPVCEKNPFKWSRASRNTKQSVKHWLQQGEFEIVVPVQNFRWVRCMVESVGVDECDVTIWCNGQVAWHVHQSRNLNSGLLFGSGQKSGSSLLCMHLVQKQYCWYAGKEQWGLLLTCPTPPVVSVSVHRRFKADAKTLRPRPVSQGWSHELQPMPNFWPWSHSGLEALSLEIIHI